MPRKKPARYVTRNQAIASGVTIEQARAAAKKGAEPDWGEAYLKYMDGNLIFDAQGNLALSDGTGVISSGGNTLNEKGAITKIFIDPYLGADTPPEKKPDSKPAAKKKPRIPTTVEDVDPKAPKGAKDAPAAEPLPGAPTPDPKELDTLSVVYMGLDDAVTAAKRHGNYWQRRMADQPMIDFLAGKDAYVEVLTHSLKDPEMSQKDTVITRAAIAATESLVADIRQKGGADPAVREKEAMREFSEANAALMSAIRDAVAAFRKQKKAPKKATT